MYVSSGVCLDKLPLSCWGYIVYCVTGAHQSGVRGLIHVHMHPWAHFRIELRCKIFNLVMTDSWSLPQQGGDSTACLARRRRTSCNNMLLCLLLCIRCYTIGHSFQLWYSTWICCSVCKSANALGGNVSERSWRVVVIE